MFAQIPEYTMLDHIESYLAGWTGRASWPITEATLETHLIVPTADGEHDFASKFAMFTYELDGVTYQAAIREIAGSQDRPAQVGDKVSIQYDPRCPHRFYYAPACRLASRLMMIAVIAAAVFLIVALSCYHI